jgi:hypothetical protein
MAIDPQTGRSHVSDMACGEAKQRARNLKVFTYSGTPKLSREGEARTERAEKRTAGSLTAATAGGGLARRAWDGGSGR